MKYSVRLAAVLAGACLVAGCTSSHAATKVQPSASRLIGTRPGLPQTGGSGDGEAMRDCIPQAIINCGIITADEFADKLAHGDGRHSGAELTQFFVTSFGISPSELRSAATVDGQIGRKNFVIAHNQVVMDDTMLSVDHRLVAFARDQQGAIKPFRVQDLPFNGPEQPAFVHLSATGNFSWALSKNGGYLVLVTGPPAGTDGRVGQLP